MEIEKEEKLIIYERYIVVYDIFFKEAAQRVG